MLLTHFSVYNSNGITLSWCNSEDILQDSLWFLLQNYSFGMRNHKYQNVCSPVLTQLGELREFLFICSN